MDTQVFAIASRDASTPGILIVSGRAYADVRVGDMLSDAPAGPPRLLVTAIISYGKQTDLLSKMMTGTVHLKGEPSTGSPQALYRG
jgi:hypothetical protein